jgi:hypothetical protein
MNRPERPVNTLSLKSILFISFLVQGLALYPLWIHQSDAPSLLGRYSTRYGLFLLVNIFVVLAWGVVALWWQWVAAALHRVREWVRYAIMMGCLVVAVIVWFIPIEDQIQQYIALNGFLVIVCLVRAGDVRTIGMRWWWAIVVAIGLLLMPIVVTIMSDQRFSPDEAHWADYATSLYRVGGVYARAWLQEPFRILPGVGWSVPTYGFFLEYVSFDIRIGRAWTLVVHLLTVAGIGLVAGRLYGQTVAVVSAAFALLSVRMVPIFDYRPDYQLSLAAVLIVGFAIKDRLAPLRYQLPCWSLLVGLSATLSLQLHAAGVVFAIGMSLLYALEFLYALLWQRSWQALRPMVSFGIGAALGTGVYWLANVQVVGGMQPFLDSLVSQRFNIVVGSAPILSWPSILEWACIVIAFVYLIWRRNTSDRLYLKIWLALMLGIVILINQPYFSHFRALYFLPVGVVIVEGLSGLRRVEKRISLIPITLILIMIAAQAGRFVDWSSVNWFLQNGRFKPTLYEELRDPLLPLLRADDTIVSTHLLIWTLPPTQQDRLVTYGAEWTAMRRWNITDPVQVWDRVQPTVVILLDTEMVINPGLEQYIEQEDFMECEAFVLRSTQIRVLRQECPQV